MNNKTGGFFKEPSLFAWLFIRKTKNNKLKTQKARKYLKIIDIF